MKNVQKILHTQHTPRRRNRESERGNVLFYILIAVVLFAALSYTVGNMMRGGNAEMIAEENASLYAGEILDYGRVMRQATQDMRISNGCDDAQISFTRESGDAYEHTSEDVNCQLFNPDGGDVNYTPPHESITASDWVFTGTNIADGVGTTAPDLIALLPDLTLPVCNAINERTSITALGADADIDFTPFTGTYAGTQTLDAADSHTHGCLNYDNSGDNYFFYQVLISR
mgnify:FL=1